MLFVKLAHDKRVGNSSEPGLSRGCHGATVWRPRLACLQPVAAGTGERLSRRTAEPAFSGAKGLIVRVTGWRESRLPSWSEKSLPQSVKIPKLGAKQCGRWSSRWTRRGGLAITRAERPFTLRKAWGTAMKSRADPLLRASVRCYGRPRVRTIGGRSGGRGLFRGASIDRHLRVLKYLGASGASRARNNGSDRS